MNGATSKTSFSTLNASALDPQVRALLEQASASNAPELCNFPIEKARELYQQNAAVLASEPPTIEKSIDRSIAGPGGDLHVRIYWPNTQCNSELPVFLFFHGGGWCLGSRDTHDHICRWLTANSDCIVVSVDYRMGPEHKFPAAVEDAVAATEWVIENAAEIGADPQRIGVGGDSAGGNLAAVVSLIMRDRKVDSLKAQLLIYPATDMTMSHESHKLFDAGYRLTRAMMVWSVVNYLQAGADVFDFRASPLLAPDHTNLPSAMIMTAGFDPLRGEADAYALKLRASGVAVKRVCYDGMVHGFIGMTDVVAVSTTALLDAAAFLKETLHGLENTKS